MPSIKILDKDTTLASGNISGEHYAFIPGLLGTGVSTKLSDISTDAIEFTSLASFRKAIGTGPSLIANNVPDKSYIMACELLGSGLPIVYKVIIPDSAKTEEGGNQVVDYSSVNESEIIEAITKDDFSSIEDRGMFDIAFISYGGYKSVDEASVTKLKNIATNRGDCEYFIDIDLTTKVNKTSDLPTTITSVGDEPDGCVIPLWVEITPTYSNYSEKVMLPGSFAYLRAFANSIKSNASWLAVAGTRRGSVICDNVSNIITNKEADELQPDGAGKSVNAITYIRPYGYTIWGNKTLADNSAGLKASSFLNIRILVHDIKRQLYKVARANMFEPNDTVLWVNFKSQITPLLDQMMTGQGISAYRIIRQSSTDRAQLRALIRITPIEAVENFELTVEVTDSGTTVEEE